MIILFRELLQFMDPKHLHWAREEAATLVRYNDDGDHGNGDDEQKKDDEDDENIEDKHFPSSNWQTQTKMAVLTLKRYTCFFLIHNEILFFFRWLLNPRRSLPPS